MIRTLRSAALVAITLALPGHAHSAQTTLTTVAERSGFRQTGRYEEVIALCESFQAAYPDAVRCESFGTTPEGRPMQLLVASRTGALDPATAHARGVPVLLVQGGIHAGEIDGKDAGFLALRQVLDGQAAKHALDRQVLLFVPVFNVDGHERFGRWNRPNQRGPEAMGWRTTAQNYNLNRDYVKADAPEMQAMLRLEDAWDPVANIDLHVTDGAKFRHDVSIQVEPLHAGDAELRQLGTAFRDAVLADLRKSGSLPLSFYPSFIENDNPASGFEDGVATARFSHGYFLLRNRFGMLVETHSWKDYATRVRTTRNAIVSVLEQVRDHGAAWRAAEDAADRRSADLAGASVPLDYKATDRVRTIDFLGYRYSRTPSDISGALMTHYDESKPETWHLPLQDEIVPGHQAVAPRAGYVVPAAQAAWVADKLRLHGIAFRVLVQPWPGAAVQTFRADDVKFATGSSESHQRLTVTGQWRDEARDVPAGSLFVPIAQARARLVMQLFEPLAPDSLLAWGEFNNAFEQKEYMEDYVAEQVARDMLAGDSALATEFQRRLAEDPAFAKDPAARLQFFYRRHSAWDERYRLYPVYRTDTPAP